MEARKDRNWENTIGHCTQAETALGSGDSAKHRTARHGRWTSAKSKEAKCVSKIRLGDYFTRASGVEAEGRMREVDRPSCSLSCLARIARARVEMTPSFSWSAEGWTCARRGRIRAIPGETEGGRQGHSRDARPPSPAVLAWLCGCS